MGLQIHVDGGARGNPGPAGAGVVIHDDAGTLVHEGAYFLGKQTNNFAEYAALIRALEWSVEAHAGEVTIHSDSELLVRQLTGEYRVKSPILKPLFEQAQLLLLKLPRWTVKHIPREENARADALANRAMDLGNDEIVFEQRGAEPAKDAAAAREAPPSANAGAPLVRSADGSVVVVVQRAKSSATPACSKTIAPAGQFEIAQTLPAGLCLHAAHALLPTIISLRQTTAEDLQHMPTVTVRCSHPQCMAQFHVFPQRRANGRQSDATD